MRGKRGLPLTLALSHQGEGDLYKGFLLKFD